MAAHSAVAGMQKLDPKMVAALRAGTPLAEPRLEALKGFTRAMVADRGHVGAGVLDAFLAAGYTEANAQEVVLGIGMKTLSNYHNHLAAPPLDEAFRPTKWIRP